jgi:hypothetical protein
MKGKGIAYACTEPNLTLEAITTKLFERDGVSETYFINVHDIATNNSSFYSWINSNKICWAPDFGTWPLCAGSSISSSDDNRTSNDKNIVFYSEGRLIISNDGVYQVTITNALGGTLMAFQGKGRSAYGLNAKTFRAGIYIAVVRDRATNGLTTQKFIVD